jgi:hypothetical protein
MANNFLALSGSIMIDGAIQTTGGDFEGNLIGTASHATYADNLNNDSLTLANLTITNTASIQYLDVVYQSASIVYSSGSNIFGDAPDDVQTLHGQVEVINNLEVGGNVVVNGNISGSFTGNLVGNVTGDVVGNVTGNLVGNVTGDVVGNVTGNLVGNVTGDLVGNAQTATSASYALDADHSLEADFAVSASHALNADSAISASHALLADGLNAQDLTLANLTITNTASIQYLDVVYQSSSVIYSSGSNIFGDSPSDTQTLHGQVEIINDATIWGNLNILGNTSIGDDINEDILSISSLIDIYGQTYIYNTFEASGKTTINDLTGSLFGTASAALNAANALTASYVETARTASFFLTSSVTSASYSETAAVALSFLTSSVTSASFALSASHLIGAKDVGFQKEWHVSVGSGSDVTGNGSLSKPYATLGKAFASVGGTGEQIVIHPGVYLESTATLTMPNVSIVSANFNAGGICYMNGTVTIAPANSSTRISGILFNNLIHSGSAGLYLDKVQVKANYTKIGSGYSEITNTDLQASGSIVFRGGTTIIQGDKQGLVQVSGSGTAVYIKDSLQVVSPSAVAGGILVISDSQVYPLASGSAAINSQAGTVTYLYNTQITTTTGLPERIAVNGFLGYDDIQFNKNLSTLGTSLNIRAHFQQADINSLTATGSLFGNASTATSASFATSASIANSINPSANITVAGLNIGSLGNYTDDVAAAAGGVPVNGVYRNGNFLVIRVA